MQFSSWNRNVMLNAVHASEAVTEAGVQRAHDLVVAPVVTRVLGHLCQTNRKIEFLNLDLGDVAPLFMVYHATM